MGAGSSEEQTRVNQSSPAGTGVRWLLVGLIDSKTPVRALLDREIAVHQTYLPLPLTPTLPTHSPPPIADTVVEQRRICVLKYG